MKASIALLSFALFLSVIGCQQGNGQSSRKNAKQPERKMARSDAEWKQRLTPNEYEIMVKEGTEPPYKNAYWNNHKKGMYVSAATGQPLFSSDTKFDSGTGWPSFWAPIDTSKVEIRKDESFGMTREEVIEKSTGLHLGHVFDDGPEPTGKRYCMNSGALKFIPAK